MLGTSEDIATTGLGNPCCFTTVDFSVRQGRRHVYSKLLRSALGFLPWIQECMLYQFQFSYAAWRPKTHGQAQGTLQCGGAHAAFFPRSAAKDCGPALVTPRSSPKSANFEPRSGQTSNQQNGQKAWTYFPLILIGRNSPHDHVFVHLSLCLSCKLP